jgi:L-rhamnonate dehydratase
VQISDIRAYVLPPGRTGATERSPGHWLYGRIAHPLSRFEEYRGSRSSFGLDVLGTVVVEIEAADGTLGIGISTGGTPAAWIIESHLRRFVVGKSCGQIELIWEQMFGATLFYGRKGLAVNAISAVDLALWDLLGRIEAKPVHALLGGAVRERIPMYATGPRPDLAARQGYVGGKLPLRLGPEEGEEGVLRTAEELAAMRALVGEGFWLAYDCWMASTSEHARALLAALAPHGLRWLEEPLPPDDYWGLAGLRRDAPAGVAIASGEHESTRWGFQLLAQFDSADIWQPDIMWCGGLSELVRIGELAREHGVLLVPHGSTAYSAHYLLTRPDVPFGEFIVLEPEAAEPAPTYGGLFVDEPLPIHGELQVSQLERPGFGLTLDPELELVRPYPA